MSELADEAVEPTTKPRWTIALSNFSVIAILFPLTVTAARVLVTSQGNPAVIYTIISTLNIKSATLGAVLTLLPNNLILWMINLWTWLELHQRRFLESKDLRIFARSFTLMLGVAVAIYSTPTALISGAIALVTLLSARAYLKRPRQDKIEVAAVKLKDDLDALERKKGDAVTHEDIASLQGELAKIRAEGRRLQKRLTKRETRSDTISSLLLVGMAFSAAAIIMQILLGPMWLPSENITLKGGPPRVGYVLDASNGDAVILYAKTTEVKRAKQTEIVSRQVCDQRSLSWFSQTLAYLLDDSTKTPRCPD